MIIPVILLSYLFSGIYAIFNAAPFYKDRTSYLLMVSGIGLIINFVLNLLLIPYYGMMGAAYATLFTYLFMSIFLFFLSQKIYKIEYNLKKIFGLFFIAFSIFIVKIIIIDNIGIDIKYMILMDVILLFIYFLLTQLTRIIELKKVKLIFNKPL